MAFDNSYFEDEIREGFYIPGMIKRSWATQLEILENVIKICERHDLKWFAGYGTLLGAVRHRGFIPWDDDLDICMIKDDYNRFAEYAEKELPDSYEVMTIYNNKEYFNFLTRILNHDLIDTTENFLDENCGFPFASGIDVFPLDYLYVDDELEERRRIKAKKLWELITDNKRENTIENGYELIRQIESLSGFKIKPNKYIANDLYKVLDKVYSEAPKTGATHVTLMPVWSTHKAQKYPIDIFDDLISVPFENTHVLIPASYDKVLRLCYGNWEIANRKGGLHDYPFYGQQEDQLEKHYGELPYKYYYQKEMKKAYNVELPPNTILPIFDTLSAAVNMINLLLKREEFDSVFELLESSQDLAIKAGTDLEKIYGEESSIVVKELEDYCENLFLLSEAINNSNQDSINTDALSASIEKIKATYNLLYSFDDILFVSYRPSDWKYVDPIYKQAIKDGKCVKVINVSYFEKTMNGNLSDEKREIEGYPEYLNIMDYLDYSFTYHRPKEIIIQNSFDQYASGFSIHPMYYSTTLKDYTDKLTYVQSYYLSPIDDEDAKGMRNAKYAIISPGIIYSDRIIVDSKQVKDLYIKIITENTDILKEDISSKIDILQEICDIEVIKPKEKDKKDLLFYIGFSDIYENPSIVIDKIKRTLEIFKSQTNINVLWGEDLNLENHIKKYTNQIYNDFINIRNSFIADGGNHIKTDKWVDIIDNTDAFYGSAGYAMNLATLKKIPIMKWNVKM